MIIGNAQGFWGDRPEGPKELMEQAPNLEVLTLDYLAEVSLSIMAIQRDKNPDLGYAQDFVEVVRSLRPFWEAGRSFKLIANAGGLNPQACKAACEKVLEGLDVTIGVVSGDDVLDQIDDPKYTTANAYLGGKPIEEALSQGADIVITGRVADPSMVVGACMWRYGWKEDAWDQLAGATIAGHLIECGAQVTGGISDRWLLMDAHHTIPFPLVEVHEDGSCIVSKPANTGGEVSIQTVTEQLLYEIGDPSNYLSPDCRVNFTTIRLEELGTDQVKVSGASGSAPTETYKVSATYRAGYKAEGMLTFIGGKVREKAAASAELIFNRCPELEETAHDIIGDKKVAMLRVAVSDPDKEKVSAFTKQIAPLVTAGPPGTTGYASGRPKVRPIFAYDPLVIKRSVVTPTVEVSRG